MSRDYLNALAEAGRKRCEDMQGAVLEWDSAEYACSASGFGQNKDLRDAGFKQMTDGTVIVRAGLFTTDQPTANDNCRVKLSPDASWLVLRIASVMQSAHGEELHLSCVAR